MALNARLFPKGALGYISCQKPVIDTNGEIVRWTNFSRFILNQDTGGAIRGSGRADIFWGSGHFAELAADADQVLYQAPVGAFRLPKFLRRFLCLHTRLAHALVGPQRGLGNVIDFPVKTRL